MKKIIVPLVLVLVSIQLYRTATDAGIFRSVEQTKDFQQCVEHSITGAEDLSIDQVTGIAYISAEDRRGYMDGTDAYLSEDYESSKEDYPNGAIWTLDLNDPNSVPVKMKMDIEGAFHPHGISLLFSEPDSPEGGRAIELYVVNHKNASHHEISVFNITEEGSLTLRRRITYPELISPNDIVVYAQDQFFVSNDHGYPRLGIMEAIENYVGMPWSSVSYFDGNEGHLVIEGLRYANGLAISEDAKTLYVAETTRRQISRYDRGASMSEWTLKDSLNVKSNVDNLEWTDDGDILIGSHPKIFDFLAHTKDTSKPSPSEVIRVNIKGETMSYESIYLNSGEAISGSSVAAGYKDQMLIGPVIDDHFLRCKI